MTTLETFIKEAEEEFRAKFDGSDYIGIHNDIEEFISYKLRSLAEKMGKEIIELSDRIELEHQTSVEEWKGFKHFRNTMRDNIKKFIGDIK